MQYMMLIYDQEARWAALSEAEEDALRARHAAFADALISRGQLVTGRELERSHTATVVREEDGGRVTTDGPFAETKEQLIGYAVLECRDLDEALAIAGRVPLLPGGAVEIRPVRRVER